MKTIVIKTQFKDDYITRAAGERLRELILQAHKKGESIQVDFTGVKVGSTSFFDEAFAKLVDEGWDRSQFEKNVSIHGMHRLDQGVLERVCKYRGI